VEETAGKNKSADGWIQNLPPGSREALAGAAGQPGTRARPEEIVVEIWRRIRELREAGRRPGRIILSAENYRAVQAWHAGLGELSDPSKDYITKHAIFNLPVFIQKNMDVDVTE
jgi:hypothetical protein